MQISPVVAQLQTVPELTGRVEIAGSIRQILTELNSGKGPRWAWVISPGDDAGNNTLSAGGIRQRVTDRYGVVLGCYDVSDRRGEAALLKVEALGQAVEPKLLGFIPAPGYTELTYRSGQMVGGTDGWVLWLHLWQSNHYITK